MKITPGLGTLLFFLFVFCVAFRQSAGDIGDFAAVSTNFAILITAFFASYFSSKVRSVALSVILVTSFSFVTAVSLQLAISYILPAVADRYYLSIIIWTTILLAGFLIQVRRTRSVVGQKTIQSPATVQVKEPQASMTTDTTIARKMVFVICFSLLVLAVAYMLVFVNQTVSKITISEQTSNNEEDLHQELSYIADDINKSLPAMVDVDTRIDSAYAMGSTFNFKVTLVNHEDDDIDFLFLEDELRLSLVSTYCRDDSTLVFRGNRVPVRSHYFDKNGIFLGVVAASTSDCDL